MRGFGGPVSQERYYACMLMLAVVRVYFMVLMCEKAIRHAFNRSKFAQSGLG